MKKLLTWVFSILTTVDAFAAATIASSDMPEINDWRYLLLTAGIFAAITCHRNKDLIHKCKTTKNLDDISRWMFRLALFVLLIPILGKLVGWHSIDTEIGWLILVFWACIRTIQAVYLSGVHYGLNNCSDIQKKLSEEQEF